MDPRENILNNIKVNQPEFQPLPNIWNLENPDEGSITEFETVLTAIGGRVNYIEGLDKVPSIINTDYKGRVINTIPELDRYYGNMCAQDYSHALADADVAIIKGHFAVSENGSVWVTDDLMGDRVLPFICQHLIIILDIKNIVATMHDAYSKIDRQNYGFGTFIAGPSKTADIEQSLVLGAHGPRGLLVLIVKNK